MKLKRAILSGDFVAGLAAIAACIWLLPALTNQIAGSIFSIGISVLSIIFSVFFAALAIILSASDDDFVAYLEQDGIYTSLIRSFRITLGSLFFALCVAIVAYVGSTVRHPTEMIPLWQFAGFAGVSVYALFATYFATLDATTYCLKRAEFVTLTHAPHVHREAPPTTEPQPALDSDTTRPNQAATPTPPQTQANARRPRRKR